MTGCDEISRNGIVAVMTAMAEKSRNMKIVSKKWILDREELKKLDEKNTASSGYFELYHFRRWSEGMKRYTDAYAVVFEAPELKTVGAPAVEGIALYMPTANSGIAEWAFESLWKGMNVIAN